MRFEQRRPDKSEERILPLINVVFLLLIFFMIAGSLSVTDPFDVSPPESSAANDLTARAITILLSADGQLALDAEPLAEAQLLTRLDQHFKQAPQTPVELKADSRVAGNQLVYLMEQLRDVGVQKLRLVTLPQNP